MKTVWSTVLVMSQIAVCLNQQTEEQRSRQHFLITSAHTQRMFPIAIQFLKC